MNTIKNNKNNENNITIFSMAVMSIICLIVVIIIIYAYYVFKNNNSHENTTPASTLPKTTTSETTSEISSITIDSLKDLLSKVDDVSLNNVTIKNLNITGVLTAGNVSINALTGEIIADNIQSKSSNITTPATTTTTPDFSELSNLKNLNITGKLTIGSTTIDAETGKIMASDIASDIASVGNLTTTGNAVIGGSLSSASVSTSSLLTKSFDPSVYPLFPKQEIVNTSSPSDTFDYSKFDYSKIDYVKLSNMPNLNVTGKLTVGNTTIDANDSSIKVGGKFSAGTAIIDSVTGNFTTSGAISGESIKTNTSFYMPYNTSITSFSDSKVGLGRNDGMMMFSPDGTLRVFDGSKLFHII